MADPSVLLQSARRPTLGRYEDIFFDLNVLSSDGSYLPSSAALLAIHSNLLSAPLRELSFYDDLSIMVELGTEMVKTVLTFVHSGTVPVTLTPSIIDAFNVMGISLKDKDFTKEVQSSEVELKVEVGQLESEEDEEPLENLLYDDTEYEGVKEEEEIDDPEPDWLEAPCSKVRRKKVSDVKENDTPGPCLVCKREYKNLAKHMERAHSIENTQCKTCHKVYKSSEALSKHISTAHKTKSCCDICGKVLGSKKLLQFHILGVHGKMEDRPFKCELCPRAYVQKLKLNEHMKSHSDSREHCCEKCGKAFYSTSRLREHTKLTLCGKEKPRDAQLGPTAIQKRKFRPNLTAIDKNTTRCDICQRIFTGVTSYGAAASHCLSVHAKAEDKPHACHLCDKRYARKDTLETHLEVHENKRNYKCSLCNAGFNSAGNRNAHERSVHLGLKRKNAEISKSRRGTGPIKKHPETAEERQQRWLKATGGGVEGQQ